jgi:transcription elongation factor Elf1
MTDTALQDLFDEIGASMGTMDADAPRETILPCPRCNKEQLVAKNQRRGLWELSCCGHTEEHRTRSKVVQHWNEWAKPFEAPADSVTLAA